MIKKILKRLLIGRRTKRIRIKDVVIVMVIFFTYLIYIITSDIQWWSLNSSVNLNKILINNVMKPITIKKPFESISDIFKENVYNQCKSFSNKGHILGSLQRNNHNDKSLLLNSTNTLENVHLLLRFSPKRDNDDLYIQIATSYLLSQNLQQLSIEQQSRTRITIFLNENYTSIMYNKLKKWFKSIYSPYTRKMYIIRTNTDNQYSLEFMINYIKSNKDIQLDTILFILDDDYIYEIDMVSDTIEFFIKYNPCFVHQTEYYDRCKLEMNNDDGYIHILPGKNRLWRSISSNTGTFVCRLRTFLAFENIFISSNNYQVIPSQKIRALVGNAAFFCPVPSYGTHLEKIFLPNEVNITSDTDMTIYFKDWWTLARHALNQAQKKHFFPFAKINQQNLFI